jgi:hypothetical protein
MRTETNIDRRINNIIFGMTIFYQIVLNSSWSYLDTVPLWKYVGYLLYGVMLFQLAVRLIHVKLTKLQLGSILFYAGMMVLFLATGNLSVASVFLLGGFALFLSVDDILTGFLYAVVLGMLTVFALAVLGALPFYNSDIQYWVFGFKNPNNVGYYFTLIFSLLMIKQWQHPTWGLFGFLVVSTVIDKYVLHDMTALMVSIVFLILWGIARKWPKFPQLRLIRWTIIASPFLLTFLTVLIGKMYTHVGFIYKLDDIFTSRPAIWHYYMDHFPMKLLGGNIPSVVTVYRGAFDGVFLYYPLTNGLIVTVVLLLAISAMLYYLLKHDRIDVVCFVLSALLFAFSENAPFFIYSSPLLVIALALATPGMKHDPNEPAIMVDDHQGIVRISD